MTPSHPLIPFAAAACTAALLAGCGGGTGATASAGTTMGSARIALTDAPGCGFDHVYVSIAKVRIHQSATASDTDGGWTDIAVSPARRIDLLNLTNGALDVLGEVPLMPGRYTQLRLLLAPNAPGQAANAVVVSGSGKETALDVPSGLQTGIKLNHSFDVAAGQRADVVLDFDACQSVAQKGGSGNFVLRPVIEALPLLVNGIDGKLDASLIGANTAISAQQDGKVIRSTIPDPVTGSFFLARLPSGTYDVVLTANGRPAAVVTGVQVQNAASIVTLGRSDAPLSWPVTNAPAYAIAGLATLTPALAGDSARVMAQQTLNGTTRVTLKMTSADLTTGAYALSSLPTAAPMVAAYGATLPLQFQPAAQVSPGVGKYVVTASAPGYQAQSVASVDVGAGNAAAVNFALAP